VSTTIKKAEWNIFFREKVKKIFNSSEEVIDIGGGLRATREKGNRYDESRSWIQEYMEGINYQVLDPVDRHSPDIVGDIHDLPFPDNSKEAIFCLAVLEHVENPHKAVSEMFRVLEKDGKCLVYVPFLYYYHAEEGYYDDYWRFSKDALNHLFNDFSSVDMVPVRGAVQTWINISPLGRFEFLQRLGYHIDKLTGKDRSDQVSGYNIFAVK